MNTFVNNESILFPVLGSSMVGYKSHSWCQSKVAMPDELYIDMNESGCRAAGFQSLPLYNRSDAMPNRPFCPTMTRCNVPSRRILSMMASTRGSRCAYRRCSTRLTGTLRLKV